MREPDEVAAMRRLKRVGWCVRADPARAGLQPLHGATAARCARWARGTSERPRPEGLKDWLAERFRQLRGNAHVVR